MQCEYFIPNLLFTERERLANNFMMLKLLCLRSRCGVLHAKLSG